MPSDLELIADRDLVDELLHRFENAIFIGVKPPPRSDGQPESVTICKWGSAELMAFHCRAFATALEHRAGHTIQNILRQEIEED
jgi:hypothetical protein